MLVEMPPSLAALYLASTAAASVVLAALHFSSGQGDGENESGQQIGVGSTVTPGFKDKTRHTPYVK
jgi:hypothetical protein